MILQGRIAIRPHGNPFSFSTMSFDVVSSEFLMETNDARMHLMMIRPKRALRKPLFCFIAILATTCTAQHHKVDFCFAPERYFATICFPDDWQKSLVTERGSLAYDFGPGPYAKPLTEISIGAKGEELQFVRQYLDDPVVPVVTTEFHADGVSTKQQAFAIVSDNTEHLNNLIDGKVRRIGGMNGCIGWASPVGKADPAFRNVAWGTNRPIKYQVKVEPGTKKRVAMGLCESYKPRAGARLIELRVEGSSPLTVDPMVDGKKNQPHVFLFDAQDTNGDGWLDIEAHASPKSPDPNVILNVFWVFTRNAPFTADEILRGEVSSQAEEYFDCGTEAEKTAPAARLDAILSTFEGNDITPVIHVRSKRLFTFDSTVGVLSSGGRSCLITRPKAVKWTVNGDTLNLELPRGTNTVELVAIHGSKNPSSPVAMPKLVTEIRKSHDYWLTKVKFPKQVLVVPDSGIQYIVDASVRNMYQVRDVVDGCAQFQPGPTVYRGLWIGDVMFTGWAAMMLGDTLATRQFLELGTHYQLPNGQVRVMHPTVSLVETPAVVFGICQYAMATGDKAWLKSQWPVVRKGIDWIRQSREGTLANPRAPFYGLMPPGFVDGGVANENPDYGTVWWSMIALEKGTEAALWLDETNDAAGWRTLFDGFMNSFRTAAQRDMRSDGHGNMFLPTIVGDTSAGQPQRGQYTFLFPFPYGKFFHRNDSLFNAIVHGNLGMLDSTLKEGLIQNSGWLKDAVWPWLGGVHGIAHHFVGDNRNATDLLYAYANHASPLGTWVEEQQTRDVGTATSGDVSNAEASAVFIHFVRNLIARERLENLEMLAGIPPEWLVRGGRIELNNGYTGFGPLTVKLNISSDGRSADVFVSAIDGRKRVGKPVVFLQTLREAGFVFEDSSPLPDVLEGSWRKELRVRFRRPR